MFTGIVLAVGHIAAIQRSGPDACVRIRGGGLDFDGVAVGDSIAVNGVCLTATALHDGGFSADVSGETLARTTFGELRVGEAVNLEKSLTLATPLGGHLVSGHVDGVGTVRERAVAGRSVRFVIEVPAPLAKYIAVKGSICVDGVSLTVNEVNGARYAVNIVPHTLQVTTLDAFQPGRGVNVEVDIVARYLERLLLGESAATPNVLGISRDVLTRHGYSVES